MKKILLLVNTYYQLIVAIQLNNTLFKDCKTLLLLSDHSKDTDVITKKLREEKIFSQVEYVKTKGLVSSRSPGDKLIDFFQISFCNNNRYSFYLNNIDDLYIDEIVFFNFLIDIYGIYSILSKYNKSLKLSLFEESVTSYGIDTSETQRRKMINYLRRIQKKSVIVNSISNFYCFYPEIYKGVLNPVEIPLVSKDGETANQLRKVFNLDIENYYIEKYIYFSGVFDFEGGDPIGEGDLVDKIAATVGADNLLIKVHPRDTRDFYIKAGYKVDMYSGVPWEAIQLSKDFSNHIFLTAASSSVLAGSFMSERPIKTFLLYKECNIKNNTMATESVHNINELLINESLKNALNNVHTLSRVEGIIE